MLFEAQFIGYRSHIRHKSSSMLTAKGKYALKALIYLSSLEPGEKAQGLAIAKAGNVPKKFLDAILGELRTAGVVFTKKGPGGGYMLARAASDIKVGHVVRAIDGPLAPIGCASRSAYAPCGDCKSVKACAVRFTMTKVRDAISDVLDRMTIADMVAMSEGGNVTPLVSGRSVATGRSMASNRKRR
jgi:Rrf2 family protein